MEVIEDPYVDLVTGLNNLDNTLLDWRAGVLDEEEE